MFFLCVCVCLCLCLCHYIWIHHALGLLLSLLLMLRDWIKPISCAAPSAEGLHAAELERICDVSKDVQPSVFNASLCSYSVLDVCNQTRFTFNAECFSPLLLVFTSKEIVYIFLLVVFYGFPSWAFYVGILYGAHMLLWYSCQMILPAGASCWAAKSGTCWCKCWVLRGGTCISKSLI